MFFEQKIEFFGSETGAYELLMFSENKLILYLTIS